MTHTQVGVKQNIPVARKSLVAAKPIRAGELFTADNLTTKDLGMV